MENKSIITVRNLHFAYETKRNSVEIIKGIDLDIKEGKITTIIGANGCGKSTLLNLISRNLKRDKGEIRLAGEDIAGMKQRRLARTLAIVHQYNVAPADLTVERLVAYGRTPYQKFGISEKPQKDKELIEWALKVTDTYEIKDKQVDKLSGGQLQRAWIAMAIAQDANVLLLDEPTTYLDVRYQLQILKLVKKLNEEYGFTIVMVLHDINQAMYYSDELVALQDGKVMHQGTPREVITQEKLQEIYQVDLSVVEVMGKRCVLAV